MFSTPLASVCTVYVPLASVMYKGTGRIALWSVGLPPSHFVPAKVSKNLVVVFLFFLTSIGGLNKLSMAVFLLSLFINGPVSFLFSFSFLYNLGGNASMQNIRAEGPVILSANFVHSLWRMPSLEQEPVTFTVYMKLAAFHSSSRACLVFWWVECLEESSVTQFSVSKLMAERLQMVIYCEENERSV